MTSRDWSEFWWNNITGANYVVLQVAQALLENKTAVIEIPSDLPWRREMRNATETCFREQSFVDAIIDVIDAADECDQNVSPGRFLLDQYGQSWEVKNSYRERSGKTLQQYLKEKSVLKHRIIWVKGLCGKQADNWVNFCKDFDPESPESGLFVLEIHGKYTRAENKSLRFINFLKYVSSYDVQLFNSFMLDTRKNLSPDWKKYLSVAAASLCDTDAEISALVLQGNSLKERSLLDRVNEIADSPSYSARGGDLDSSHVLTYARAGESAELEKRLWKAQVQTLFPLIEMERLSIVEYYKDLLSDTLSHSSVEQYKARITDPVDLELGTFCYLLTVNSVSLDNPAARERIFFLHECRNRLAHAHCCSKEQICRLLDEAQYF